MFIIETNYFKIMNLADYIFLIYINNIYNADKKFTFVFIVAKLFYNSKFPLSVSNILGKRDT